MDRPELVQWLKNEVEVFSDFSESELDEIVAASLVRTFERNEAMIKFGETGRVLGVLIEGKAEAKVTDDVGDTHSLGTIGPGQVFGEMSLMTGNKSMANVMCTTRCKVVLIPQGLISSNVATHPSIIAYLSRLMIDRLKSTAYEGRDGELAASALKSSEDPYDLELRTEQPMKLLVVNSDPNALKYALFDTTDPTRAIRGMVENIGTNGARHTWQSWTGEQSKEMDAATHGEALTTVLDDLSEAMGTPVEVSAVGHRIVHGGEKYTDAVVVTDEVCAAIGEAAELAPLHNPVNLAGIEQAAKLFPDAPQVAVFDTGFHGTMPPYAYLYALPYEYYEEKKIRRYGFHGLSHSYVSLKVAQFLKRPYNELETIVCHLGVGASICAVDHGRSVDTSMGLTPSEGLMMGTRTGDLDPGLVLYLMRREGLDANQLHELVNKESGLKGMSGVSDDMREIIAAAEDGHARALLAIRTYAYRLRKYIGAYAAAMGGLDALAFTGGIGMNSVRVRGIACQSLAYMGIRIDEAKNRAAKGGHEIHDISTEDSKVRVLVVPTDEERMVARQTLRALDRSKITENIRRQEPMPIPIEVSAHHMHLAQEHIEALFGEGAELTPMQDLSQPGQFACEEKVNLIGPRGRIDNVRVLGPARPDTQVEISKTEQFKLGIQAPIRESGKVKGTPGVTLEGPEGQVVLEQGVICALRHIHMTPEDALRLGLKDQDVVMVRVEGERELIYGDILVRVSPKYKLAMHLDTDEANAADIKTGMQGFIDRIQKRA